MCAINEMSSLTLPLVNALLTEAVGAGQDEVGLSVHADAALLLISQLLHSVAENTHRSRGSWKVWHFLPLKHQDTAEEARRLRGLLGYTSPLPVHVNINRKNLKLQRSGFCMIPQKRQSPDATRPTDK